MADGILPALLVLSVEREQVHDELVDFTQRQHLGRRVLYRHRDQRDVRVGRLGVRVAPPIGFVVASTASGSAGAPVPDASAYATTSSARVADRRQIGGTAGGRPVA